MLDKHTIQSLDYYTGLCPDEIWRQNADLQWERPDWDSCDEEIACGWHPAMGVPPPVELQWEPCDEPDGADEEGSFACYCRLDDEVCRC